METIPFEMKMVDSMTAPLKAMGGELSQLESQLKSERKELAQMEAAMRSLNKASVVDIGTSRQLRDQISAKKDAVAGLVQQQVKLGSVGKVAEKDLSKLGKTFTSSASEAASADSAIAGMGAELGALVNPVTLAAGAFLGLGAALGFLLVKGVSLSLSAAQAKEDVEDSLSLVLDTQEAVESTYDGLSDIADKLGAPVAATQKMAESLALAGVESKDTLLDAVDAIQTASKFSDVAGQKLQSIVEKAGAAGAFKLDAKALKGTGVSIKDVTAQLAADTGKGVKQVEAEMKAGKISLETGVQALSKAVDVKLGAGAREKATGFDESITRIGNKMTKIFENVNIKPFEEALSRVVDLFDSTGDQAGLVQDVLDAVFKLMADAVPYAEGLLLGLELALLNIYNATFPLRKALKEAFGGHDLLPSVQSMDDALMLVADAVGWVVTQLAELASHKVILYGLALAAAAVIVPFVTLISLPYLLVAAFVALLAAGAKVESWLLGLGEEALTAGANLVDGLVQGILDAGPKLLQSIKDLAGQGLDAFKSVFKIHSPSLVMAEVGENLGLGLEKGLETVSPARTMEDEAEDARDAATSTGGPSSRFPALSPQLPSAAPSGGSASSGSDRPTITVDMRNMQVTITGVKGAEDVAPSMMTALGDLLEQAGLTLGTRPTGSGVTEAA